MSLKRAVAVSLAVYDRADRVETAREHAVVRCARPTHAPPPPRTPTHDSHDHTCRRVRPAPTAHTAPPPPVSLAQGLAYAINRLPPRAVPTDPRELDTKNPKLGLVGIFFFNPFPTLLP